MSKMSGFGISVKLVGDEVMVMCPSTVRSDLLSVGLIGDVDSVNGPAGGGDAN